MFAFISPASSGRPEGLSHHSPGQGSSAANSHRQMSSNKRLTYCVLLSVFFCVCVCANIAKENIGHQLLIDRPSLQLNSIPVNHAIWNWKLPSYPHLY